MLEIGPEESETQAMKLMECVIANSAVTYAALDTLYVELKIGGGFFRGRKMSTAVDERTRYELVGYITALAAILVRASRDPQAAESIVAALEKLVFLPEWHVAPPLPQIRGSLPGYQSHRSRCSSSPKDIADSLASDLNRCLGSLLRITLGGWSRPTVL
jgi:hypothetical protein